LPEIPKAERWNVFTASSYQGLRSAISLVSARSMSRASVSSATGGAKLTGQAQPSVSPSGPGASSGKSARTGGVSWPSNSSRAARRTRRWKSGWFGAPNGRPSSNGTASARGGRIFSVWARTRLMPTVGTPSSSR
jgi:hypothetical protein